LFQRGTLGAPVKLGRHENFIAVTIFEGFADALFAYSLVVVPGIVRKIYSAVDCGMKNLDGVRLLQV
jgi:hypothetical protein